jgi:hypothetical protein
VQSSRRATTRVGIVAAPFRDEVAGELVHPPVAIT